MGFGQAEQLEDLLQIVESGVLLLVPTPLIKVKLLFRPTFHSKGNAFVDKTVCVDVRVCVETVVLGAS